MLPIVYLVGGVILILVLTILGILSRYKKCAADEVLVVYGKIGGKTSCKCYHGGAAFIWPVFQGYKIMSMKPMQIQCDLKGALSSQKINVDVPTVVTVAISTEPEVMQTAAIRLLDIDDEKKEDLIKDVIWGQMRLVVAEMTVEQLISDRDNFLGSCRQNIDTELRKFGLYLMNINISDIKDDAEYILNLGKEAAAKAKYEALSNIEKREKEGSIGIASQKKEKDIELSNIEKERQIQVNANVRDQDIETSQIEKDQRTKTAEINREKEVTLREIEKDQAVQLKEREKEEQVSVRDIEKQQVIETAELERQEATERAKIESERDQIVAEKERQRDAEVARQKAEKEAEIAAANAEKDTKVAEYEADRDASIAQRKNESEKLQKKAIYGKEAAVTEEEQKAAARKVKAEEEAEALKEKARQEKDAAIATFESTKRQTQAKADQDAQVMENKAAIEVAKSEAQKGKEEALAKQIIGESSALAEQKIGEAEAEKIKAIAKKKGEATEAELQATLIIPAEKDKEKMKTEAEGYAVKVTTEAKADAEAEITRAKAKAEAIRLMKLADAEGELALAKVQEALKAAESANIVALKNAGMDDTAIVQWTLKDEYKHIAEADAKKFEHVQTGSVTVVGGSDAAADFMVNTVKKIQEFSALKTMIPGAAGVLSALERFDNKQIEKTTATESKGDENQMTSEGKEENPSEPEQPEFPEVK